MKATYRLEGLDCANCAAKLERSIKKMDGVIETNINFMMAKLSIECKDEEVLEKVLAFVKKNEPSVVIRRI